MIIKRNGREFIDILEFIPEKLANKIISKRDIGNDKIEIYLPAASPGKGHDSKKFVINKFIELDDLFFEAIGLWQGEGGKNKGLYFGNTCVDVLLHFLKFVEERLGLPRDEFKVTVSSRVEYDGIVKKWSEILKIPIENFTNICINPRAKEEYAQIYINGIVLVKLMKALHEKLKQLILSIEKFTIAYLRGIIAAEGQVAIRPWGTIHYVSISSANLDEVKFYKDCLKNLKIESGRYQSNCRKFPIYGRRNLEKVREFKLCILHPKKEEDFKIAMSKYQRNVMKGTEMEELILKQLGSGQKTYDDIALALNKGRSTIQSHYIPILENKKFIKRIGKRRAAWLFGITNKGIKFLENNKIKALPL